MIKRVGLSGIIILMLMAGCGTLVPTIKQDELKPDQRRMVNEVEIFNQQQLGGRKYRILAVVEGISCKNKVWDHAATKSDAILQARYWARQSGADAITSVQCDVPRGTTVTYNCWESITCTAEAIKFEQ